MQHTMEDFELRDTYDCAEAPEQHVDYAADDSGIAPPAQTRPRPKKRRALFWVAIIIEAIIFLAGAVAVVHILLDYTGGQAEYEQLRQVASAPQLAEGGGDGVVGIDYQALRDINADFVAWIEIPDTAISYPVVYSESNATYHRTSFNGKNYMAGSIYMDYRSIPDFSGYHAVIYGHMMNDGSMFSGLKDFLKPDYLAKHQNIFIFTETEKLTYTIFAAREVNVTDEAFTYAFQSGREYAAWQMYMAEQAGYSGKLATSGTAPTLTLSTCTNNARQKNRYIVQAVLIEKEPF